ncbi:hypothetical protein ACIHCM_31095 [Streptomyces sp. NPDC052023]|uniref:hypothetical protein n=1 Tax=Streptomyces sp. NPDC052023 TaxID=3365681 RepID=UPI0037CE613A
MEQPFLIDGHPVTFWHLIVEGDQKATYGELGGVLRDLRSLTVPEGLVLPSFAPSKSNSCGSTRAVIPDDDKVLLRKRWRKR